MSSEPIDIEKTLRLAFDLGQTYWQQADSESYSQNRKSEATHAKFNALVAEVAAATPPARLHAPLSDEQIEAAAQELAEVMHYHWKYMPAKGRDAMRDNARRVLAAAGITAAPSAPKEQA